MAGGWNSRWRHCLVLLPVLVLVGCATADPNTSPTFSCTPETGGTPYSCAKPQHDVLVERERLYAEAEAVLAKDRAENERIYRLGGVTQATPVMMETNTGEALAESLKDYQALHAEHSRQIGGAKRYLASTRTPKDVRDGSVVSIKYCVDSTGVTMTDGADTWKGGSATEQAYFQPVEGKLKVSLWISKEVSSSG